MAQIPKRFGQTSGLGSTYTLLGTVPALTSWNMLFNIASKLTTTVKVRIYIADTSWSTGEPTGGTLKVVLAYDWSISPGVPQQLSGIVANTTEKIVVWSDTASGLDISLSGMEIT